MTLRKSLTYIFIFTVVASLFTYKIIVSAYKDTGQYDIENLKR